MTNREYLLKVIKPQISVGEKDADEMIRWLKQRFDIRFLSENDAGAFILRMNKKDALAIAKDRKRLGESDDESALEFHIVEIERNEKSEMYYRERGDDFFPTTKIVVYLERKTGFLSVDTSSRLFAELIIEKGITQYDFDQNTPQLMQYLSCLKEKREKDAPVR